MISIKDLQFAYKRKKIFTGLSLELQPGYIYGLLGKNGRSLKDAEQHPERRDEP